MTYEEIISIVPGSIVPGGCSVNPNATYMGPGELILDSNGNALAEGHSISTNDMIVVLDIGYTKQLALIQYPIGNGEYRQGYIVNNSNNIQYPNIGTNNWINGSTTESVYLSYEGNQVLGSLEPYESAIFLYKVNDRYNIVYSTDKGIYTKTGFVNYSGGITDQALEGQVLNGESNSSVNNLPAGSVVSGGRTYPVNAIAQVNLDLRDEQGNSIPGREVSAGDELTVLDVGYTKQLALVQYPSGESIIQGYITNDDKYIKYINLNNWYNGSTPEPVLDANGVQIGTINPYEVATKLYEANGLTEVVYDTDKGINTKSGFVKYVGTTPNIVHIDIPYPNITSAELINYGTSGKGRDLRAYKIGNGRNSFIYNCAIHGWEDNWPADGIELTKIGNQIIEHFQNNSTGDFTLYVIPVANPDGLSEGWTNNGPGRCTVVGGIDCNRDFPVGFTPGGRSRNYTGSEPLNVPESKYLANFIQEIKNKTTGKTYLIDMHGWEQSVIGSSLIGEHFVEKLGLEAKYRYANAGYLIDWANSIGIISALIELPTATYSHADVVNRNYAGKIIEGLTEIIGTSSSSTSTNYNKNINDKYINIAKAFGFNLNKTTPYDCVNINNIKNNISFKGTAEVVNEQLLIFNSIRVYNGKIINAPKSFETLKIPYGNTNIIRIAEMLGNGLINYRIENNRLSIIITAIENGERLSSSLKMSLENIGVINGWMPLLSGINSKKSSNTSIGKDILLGLVVVGIIAGLIAFAPGTIAVASEVGIEAIITGVVLESAEKFVEDNGELTTEEIVEKAQAMAPQMQEDLKVVAKDILLDDQNTKIQKLCTARDLTQPDNIYRRAFGASGTYFENPTIGNSISEDMYGVLNDKQIAEELVKQSEYSLTDKWLKELYIKNQEFFEREGLDYDSISEELGKFRKMIEETKEQAKNAGKGLNEFGEYSFEEDWNVENCAEIWATRNAIINGAKLENIVLKTVNLNGLKYAPPCANCQVTFESFIKSGRMLK